MENNLPTNLTNQTSQGPISQQSEPTQPVPPMAEQPQSQVPQQSQPVNKSHLMRTLLIIMAVCVVVLLAVYIYLSFVNKEPDSSSVQIENAISPVPTKTAEQELNSIDVGDIEDDLKEVDADLQGL